MFRSAQEAELSYEHGRVKLHDLAEYRRRGERVHILTTVGRIIFNERIMRALEETLGDKWDPARVTSSSTSRCASATSTAVIERLVAQHGPHAVALVLDAFKDVGFPFATAPASRSRRTTS